MTGKTSNHLSLSHCVVLQLFTKTTALNPKDSIRAGRRGLEKERTTREGKGLAEAWKKEKTGQWRTFYNNFFRSKLIYFLKKHGVICVLEQITPEDTTEYFFLKAKRGSYDLIDGCVMGSSMFCCVPPGWGRSLTVKVWTQDTRDSETFIWDV